MKGCAVTSSDSEFISEDAVDRLLLEQHWLDASRTHFKAKDSDYLQLVFADNANPDDSIDVIRQFTLCIKQGVTPPAKLLIAVANRFDKYLNAKPAESLDTSFDLRPKQRVGHPLKHRATKEERGRIVYFMYCLRRSEKLNGNDLSIENAAGRAINQLGLLDLTEDALKKDYLTMNADEIFDRAIDALGDALTSSE